MAPTRPNILFLTIDALRTDRTGFLGYSRPTTPTLDNIAKSSIVCTQAVSNAAFSQPSLTSLFTSSLPLSHGGYDRGVGKRPKTIFGLFKDAGYSVNQITPYPSVSRYSGYLDETTRDNTLFTLNTIPSMTLAIIRETIAAFERDQINEASLIEEAGPFVRTSFDAVKNYCDVRLDQKSRDKHDFKYSRLVNDGYDYRRVKKLVIQHEKQFNQDQTEYFQNHLVPFPGGNGWLARDWKYLRTPKTIVFEGLFRLSNLILNKFNPSLAKFREYRFKRYVDCADISKRIISLLEESADDKRPFFLWSHFFDTHVPYCAGRGPKWYKKTPDYLSALGYNPSLDISIGLKACPQNKQEWQSWSALYDAAIRYVDDQLSNLMENLRRRGFLDNTIVIICGDHGEELGEHGNISHHFLPYEHNIRVPMIFHGPGIAQKTIDEFTSLLDVGPTMAALTGIDPDPSWEGKPVTDPSVNDRDFQIVECFHGGNCLYTHRPLYIGVRTKTHKFFWKEYKDPTDKFSLDGHELYDLTSDPEETNNIYYEQHPAVLECLPIIASRMADIPEISNDRLVSNFNELGHCVIRERNGRQKN